jgi:hypothetical protein
VRNILPSMGRRGVGGTSVCVGPCLLAISKGGESRRPRAWSSVDNRHTERPDRLHLRPGPYGAGSQRVPAPAQQSKDLERSRT